MFFKLSKIAETKAKVAELTSTLVELQKQIEQQAISNTMERNNLKRQHEMKLEEERHTFKLQLQEKVHLFEQEKKVWEADRKREKDLWEEKEKQFKADINRETELHRKEIETLAMLKSEQQIAQIKLAKDKEIQEVQATNAKELVGLERKLQEDYYKKLNEALNELHSKGNLTTEFLRSMMDKILDKGPILTNKAELKVLTNHMHE